MFACVTFLYFSFLWASFSFFIFFFGIFFISVKPDRSKSGEGMEGGEGGGQENADSLRSSHSNLIV